jgi:hypothetical protein
VINKVDKYQEKKEKTLITISETKEKATDSTYIKCRNY